MDWKQPHKLLERYERMIRLAALMSEADRLDLEAWERTNVGTGRYATSDWPGWERLNGLD